MSGDQAYDRGDVLETSVTLGQVKDAYLIHMLNKLATFDRTIENMTDVTDPKPRFMARLCIAGMLDDAVRDKMMKEFDAAIAKFKEEVKDNETRGELIVLTSQNAIAQV